MCLRIYLQKLKKVVEYRVSRCERCTKSEKHLNSDTYFLLAEEKNVISYLLRSPARMFPGEDSVCCSITELRYGYSDRQWEGLLGGDIRNKFPKLLAAA
jgi:hypothetical protein